MMNSKYIALLFIFPPLTAVSQSIEKFSELVEPVSKNFLSSSDKKMWSLLSETRLSPLPLAMGYPLIQTKGIVKGEGYLYVADTGKDGTHNEPAKIWKFDPRSRQLSKFYEGPLLKHAKWLYFRAKTKSNIAELYISDYGEEPISRSPGTGVGAKVLAIPVDEDGNAGTPRVVYEGSLLRSPEGITVVGDTVVLADWAAGAEATLPDREGKFLRGRVYTMPTSGGTPTELFQDHLWVTLIGACRYVGEDGQMYVRFIDLDSGRPEATIKYLPQSGTVEFFRSKILSERPFQLGKLERVVIREQVPISINFRDVRSTDKIVIRARGNSIFPNGANRMRYSGNALRQGSLNFSLDSDRSAVGVLLEPEIQRRGKSIKLQPINIRKIMGTDYRAMEDNKHGGAISADLHMPRLVATADGTSRALYLIAPNGGTPVTLWQGKPFSQPMGVQYSWNGSKVWMTDQDAGPDGTAAIFELQLPPVEDRLSKFPKLGKQLPVKPASGFQKPIRFATQTALEKND